MNTNLQFEPDCSICAGTGKTAGQPCVCTLGSQVSPGMAKPSIPCAKQAAGSAPKADEVPYDVWQERVACARVADAFAHEEGPGERRYSGNIISARILARTSGKRVALPLATNAVEVAPIDMILHCPKCGQQHIDVPEDAECDGEIVQSYGWSNPPHRSHLCHGCGHIWRPADVPTNGVAAIQTRGKNDSPPAERTPFAPESSLRNWLTTIHDNGLSLGDRLQRISVSISGILRGDAPHKYPPHTIREQCSCGFKEAIAEAKGASTVLDSARLDWLSAAVENGCVTSCFEMDGGVHLTLEGVGEEPKAYRNQNDLRAAIDAAREAEKGGVK